MSDPLGEFRCLEGLEEVPPSLRGCVLTIGNFDGVHLGHQLILATALALGGAEGVAVAALTFEPAPEAILRPRTAPPRISPPDQKVRLLAACGVECVVVARTDHHLLGMSPTAFVEQVIAGRFGPRHIVEGNNFRFGRGRSGSVDTLRRLGAKYHFDCHVVEPVLAEMPEGPTRVSSTLVRELVLAGRVEQAARCLGRPFTLYERIVPGQGVGRQIEFPTANLQPTQQLVPGDGVYAGWAAIDGGRFSAAISVGNKPTFGGGPRVVEAFLLGAAGDLYGSMLALSFLQRLRDQQQFSDPGQLKAQIERDVQRVREICQ